MRRTERTNENSTKSNSSPRSNSGLLSLPSYNSRRNKVALRPGHSPLDWANLNYNTPRHVLRGVSANTPPPKFLRISQNELKKHSTRDDCWTCINGKVFNITPYVDFHPGGVGEIMKCAGKDGTSLFNKYHSWVSIDRMLENCLLGLISYE